jgi:hypothetical protein
VAVIHLDSYHNIFLHHQHSFEVIDLPRPSSAYIDRHRLPWTSSTSPPPRPSWPSSIYLVRHRLTPDFIGFLPRSHGLTLAVMGLHWPSSTYLAAIDLSWPLSPCLGGYHLTLAVITLPVYNPLTLAITGPLNNIQRPVDYSWTTMSTTNNLVNIGFLWLP